MKNASLNTHLKSIAFLFVLTSLFGFSYHSNAAVLQENSEQEQSYTEYKGKVLDSNTNKPLVFADVTVVSTNIGTITNKEGNFSLKIPEQHLNKNVSISFLGYETKILSLSSFTNKTLEILLKSVITELDIVNINAPKNAKSLVEMALNGDRGNYLKEITNMTAFYRETIKKGKKNASLAEAVVKIIKQPYNKNKNDAIDLIKSRKNTNYSRLDTIALKLQGGPYSTLYSDLVKYPKYVFSEDFFQYYNFSFGPSTQINKRKVYVVDFKQLENVATPLYYGKLFIDAESFALVSAVYQLNLEDKNEAIKLFVKKKPSRVRVEPLEAIYRVDYRLSNGKWHYSYSNLQLGFKVKWRKKLFASNYTLNVEMAVTDWENNLGEQISIGKRIKPSIILSNEASGFSDPEFWGQYNIIEPEKSIESAIKKISKQLKRDN